MIFFVTANCVYSKLHRFNKKKLYVRIYIIIALHALLKKLHVYKITKSMYDIPNGFYNHLLSIEIKNLIKNLSIPI